MVSVSVTGIDWSKVPTGTWCRAKLEDDEADDNYNEYTIGRVQKIDGEIFMCQNYVHSEDHPTDRLGFEKAVFLCSDTCRPERSPIVLELNDVRDFELLPGKPKDFEYEPKYFINDGPLEFHPGYIETECGIKLSNLTVRDIASRLID